MDHNNWSSGFHTIQKKRTYLHYLSVIVAVFCLGAAPSRTQTYTSGETISSSEVTENEDNIFNYLQAGVDTIKDGSIVNADVSGSANIQSEKLNLAAIGSDVAITSAGSFDNNGATTLDGAVTITGTLAPNGATTFGANVTFASQTIADLGTVTTANIDGGTLDGAVVGGSSAANGTFTNLTANTTLKVGTTNQGDILYDNGTSIVRLTPGTDGQFLETNGAAANPQWTSVSQDFTLISATAVAGANSGDITIAADKVYKVVIEGITNQDQDPLLRFNSDSTGYDDADGAGSTSGHIELTSSSENLSANTKFFAELLIDTTKTGGDSAFVQGKSLYKVTGGNYKKVDLGGIYTDDTTITDFEILVASGTFTGNVYLFELTLS